MTNAYTIYSSSGAISRTVEVPDLDTLQIQLQPGEQWIAGDLDAASQYVRDGQVMSIPARPAGYAVFDHAAGQWTDDRSDEQIAADAEAEQVRRAAAVNAERARRLEAGTSFAVSWTSSAFPMTGRQFDQTVILGLLQRATAYQAAGETGAVIMYRDAQNVIHYLTPAQFLELGSKAVGWVEAVMASSWTLKDTPPIPADFKDDKHWP